MKLSGRKEIGSKTTFGAQVCVWNELQWVLSTIWIHFPQNVLAGDINRGGLSKFMIQAVSTWRIIVKFIRNEIKLSDNNFEIIVLDWLLSSLVFFFILPWGNFAFFPCSARRKFNFQLSSPVCTVEWQLFDLNYCFQLYFSAAAAIVVARKRFLAKNERKVK